MLLRRLLLGCLIAAVGLRSPTVVPTALVTVGRLTLLRRGSNVRTCGLVRRCVVLGMLVCVTVLVVSVC